MQTIAIFQESDKHKKGSYWAIRGQQQAKGKTPGQALDSLEKLVSSQKENSLVILQRFQADAFFPKTQQNRLQLLMNQLHDALKNDTDLSADDRTELEQLIDVEWAGAIARGAAIIAQLSANQTKNR